MKITRAKTTAIAALLGGSLAIALPAQANGPKALDAAQGAILIKATPTKIAPEDFPWGLKDGRTETVEIPFQGAVIALPWLEVERDGDDAVTVTFPPEASVTSGPDGGFPVVIEVSSKNSIMDFKRADGGDDIDFSMTSDMLNVTIASPEAMIALNGEFAIDNLAVAADIKQFNAMIAAAEANMPFGEEVVEILDFAAKISADSYSSTMSSPKPGQPGQTSTSSGESGPWSGELVMRDGRLSANAISEGGKMSMNDPVPIDVTHGEVSYAFSMPTKASPDPQEMSGSMRVGEINVNESLWAMVDPQGAFDHTFTGFAVDLSFIGIFKASMMGPMRGGAESIDPKTATLNTLEFDGLGLQVEGKGDAAFNGGNPSEVTGLFSVTGLSEVVAAAQKIGLMPPQQAQMIEGMANQLGKKDGDALVFDIKTDGAMMLINDAPIAPLPGAQ